MTKPKNLIRLMGIAQRIIEEGLVTKMEMCEAAKVKPTVIDIVLVSAENMGLYLYTTENRLTGALNAREWLQEQEDV